MQSEISIKMPDFQNISCIFHLNKNFNVRLLKLYHIFIKKSIGTECSILTQKYEKNHTVYLKSFCVTKLILKLICIFGNIQSVN